MPSDLESNIRSKYGSLAQAAAEGEDASCCGGCGCDPVTSDLYDAEEAGAVPAAAARASLGCGNPTALASLAPGETVLDLGSGGGIDVLLSARRVGPTGKAYGLDMTDEMLALARKNQREAGVENVEFLKGHIESIPLPADSVDVIISNCVINLSGDKRRVFAEAFRVLKPGGRLAVSDIVVRGSVSDQIRQNVELYLGCVAGALEETEFTQLLADAGFHEVSIEPTRVYTLDDLNRIMTDAGLTPDAAAEVEGRFVSAFVRAVKQA